MFILDIQKPKNILEIFIKINAGEYIGIIGKQEAVKAH